MDDSSQEELQIKLLLLGDYSVGKTSLMSKFVGQQQQDKILATIGIDFIHKVFFFNNRSVKVTIFDIAGQVRFKNLAKNLYRNVDGIIVVYDVNQIKSKNSVENWLKVIKENTDGSVKILIVGNKLDLNSRCVSYEEGQKMSHSFGYPFVETSAFSGEMVDEAFWKIINEITSLRLISEQNQTASQYGEPSSIKVEPAFESITISKKTNKVGCCYK